MRYPTRESQHGAAAAAEEPQPPEPLEELVHDELGHDEHQKARLGNVEQAIQRVEGKLHTICEQVALSARLQAIESRVGQVEDKVDQILSLLQTQSR